MTLVCHSRLYNGLHDLGWFVSARLVKTLLPHQKYQPFKFSQYDYRGWTLVWVVIEHWPCKVHKFGNEEIGNLGQTSAWCQRWNHQVNHTLHALSMRIARAHTSII